jgi:hypothetical protein
MDHTLSQMSPLYALTFYSLTMSEMLGIFALTLHHTLLWSCAYVYSTNTQQAPPHTNDITVDT